jgi:FtsP/CotA-like multicopper oxidase with cupredoxin domain
MISRLLVLLVVSSTLLAAADHLPAIAVNDNRSPAGELRNGVLNVRLVLGEGRWRPESEDGQVLTVYAFGESGERLQNPGPLIRVPQGTEIQAFVHNTLPQAATVHGLGEKPGKQDDALLIPPGATREVRFKAGSPGTHYYWATTTGSTVQWRTPVETQLSGAFIIDPPGVVATDRVFVIGLWYQGVRFTPDFRQIAVVNGKSWPYSERFTFHVGETVLWRWVNPSILPHAMHLHGFYFHVNGVGDGKRHQAYREAERPFVVTQLAKVGDTFDMSWTPERAGRWLFHCHMLVHMSPHEELATEEHRSVLKPASHKHGTGQEIERAGMGGLVLGITVLGREEDSSRPVWRPERKMQLEINQRREGERPLYALEVRDAAKPQSPSPGRAPKNLIGPPLVLTRGQPVEIEVLNRTQQPTAIHWHGIELESYYDGVAGWTGTSQQTTPAIQPGGSFTARMAPPRAGTFIYHTHWHELAQLENGIYGPLIVMPPGRQFDPAHDKVFLFSMGLFEPFGPMLLINGRPQPAPIQLSTGRKYRFRLINIAPNQAGLRASLRRGPGTPVQWRIIAKDGADLAPLVATMQTADLPVTVGETYDFEYEAAVPEELALEIYLPGPKLRVAQSLVFTASQPGK